jgi:hypothetical protein
VDGHINARRGNSRVRRGMERVRRAMGRGAVLPGKEERSF